MKHPDCGGELMIEHSTVRFMRRLRHRIYDLEGNLFREEDSP